MKAATFREKLGYGIASLGDAVSYGLAGTFLLFFLTTIAHIPPATAGAIVAVGSVWNAVFNPIMGYISDNVSTRFGRRRPVIFVFSIFLGITMFLLFTDVPLSTTAKSMYYGIMTVLFWTSFTGFFTPYCALGTDYASTYDERTSIRSFASFFNMIGNAVCMVLPTAFVDLLVSHGLSDSRAWSVTGALLGILTTVTIVITVIVSKNRDLPCVPNEKKPEMDFNLIHIFGEYISVARLRPMKYLIAASLSSLIAYSILTSNVMYYFTFNLELSATQSSAFLVARSLLGLVMLPVVSKLSMIFDKRIALILCYAAGIVGMIAVKLVGIESLAGTFIYVVFLMICTAIYWQMMPAIYYDMCDYDTAVTGKKREAMILSFQGLVEAVAVGIGGQILGAILQAAGFDGDASVQTASAMEWIENSATILPMIFLIIACIALFKYPLTRESRELQRRHGSTNF